MSDENDVELLHCHLCLTNLKRHPLYDPSVGMTCSKHGDFFIQRLRGQKPVVIFRPFNTRHKEKIIADVIDELPSDFIEKKNVLPITEKLVTPLIQLRNKPEPLVYRSPFKRHRRSGNPGIRIRCDQTGQVFGSLLEAGKVLNISETRICMQLKGTASHVQGYTFTRLGQLESEDPPWEKRPAVIYGGGVPAIGVFCVETQEYFRSLKEATKKIKASYTTLSNHLNDPANHPKIRGYTYIKMGYMEYLAKITRPIMRPL